MMRLATIFFLLFFSLHLFAQRATNYKEHIDSLVNEMNAAKNDSAKARIAFLISDQWSYTDLAKSGYYLAEAQQLSKNNDFLKGLYFFYYAGYVYDSLPDAAMKNYLIADEKLKRYNTQEAFYFRSKSWRNYATLQQRQNDHDGMLKSLINHALPLAKKSGDKEIEGSQYILVGQIFMNKIMYKKADYYLKEGLAILKTNYTQIGNLLDAYYNSTNNYVFMDSLAAAKKLLNEWKVLLNPKAGDIYLLDFYTAESFYLRRAKLYTDAINAMNTGIKLAKKLKDDYAAASLKFQLYKTYFETGRYNEAKKLLLEITKGASDIYTENRLTQYFGLSETYEKLGNIDSAYLWLKQYSTLLDSVHGSRLKETMAEQEAKYQKAEKEKEILALKNQQALDRQQKKSIHLFTC